VALADLEIMMQTKVVDFPFVASRIKIRLLIK
jgi:hypothetical protein